MNEAIREQLSAWIDGELPDNEAELLIRRMSQDAGLRRDVADFLAIGRVVRNDLGVAAADRLHGRVAAALDDGDSGAREEAHAGLAARSLKPLVGVAVAASVALVALFVLQMTSTDESQLAAPAVADSSVPSATPRQEVQRQYFLNHADAAADLGANGINSRLVTLELEVELDAEPEETPAETETR